MKKLIVAASLVCASQQVFAAPAINFATMMSMGTFNSGQYDSATVGGVTLDGFVYSGGTTYVSNQGYLWMRNNTNDHGIGYCSTGETCGSTTTTGSGDYNELSNEKNNEVIRLTRSNGTSWSNIFVSSLDSGGTASNETGTVYWSNTANADLSTLSTKATFSYSQIAPSVEGSIFGLLPGFDVSAKYVYFRAGPANGTNNDYLVWGVNVNPISVSSVPEPETYAMILAGLGLMGFVARRRKAKQPAA